VNPKRRFPLFRDRAVRLWKKLAKRGRTYWVVVFLAIGVGAAADWYWENQDSALPPRYWIYQQLLYLTPWKARANRTALVIVGDKEYWGPDLAGRSPIRRDYLAKLIRAIDAAEPQLIAIDFDLSAPPRTLAEDAELIRAIQAVSRHRPVVLPATLEEAPQSHDKYRLQPQIYSGQTFSSAVRIGHIAIFADIRVIPMGLLLATRARQDSFSEAIVRLVDPGVLEAFTDAEDSPFATFVNRNRFLEVDASSVLAGRYQGPLGTLRPRIVIVSGDWEKEKLGHKRVDAWSTPVGSIPGSFVQANYVEALLGSRAYRELNGVVALLIELSLATALVFLFALDKISLTRFIALCVVAIASGYVLLANLARYYEVSFPLALLALHALFERVREKKA
jgi:CHASE2 domain-containing sensor protein